MITAAILIGVALALAVWKQMRFAAANPTSRLPMHRWPPNVPTGARTLGAVSIGVLVYGALQLTSVIGHYWLGVLSVGLLYEGVISVPMIVHNRRVARTNDPERGSDLLK
jgi:hypothetical protein